MRRVGYCPFMSQGFDSYGNMIGTRCINIGCQLWDIDKEDCGLKTDDRR